MTVKELKEALEQFPDNCIVMIPNPEQFLGNGTEGFSAMYIPSKNVSQGVNELDGYVFIDDYEEDDEDEV